MRGQIDVVIRGFPGLYQGHCSYTRYEYGIVRTTVPVLLNENPEYDKIIVEVLNDGKPAIIQSPCMDLFETKSSYLIEALIPGVIPESVVFSATRDAVGIIGQQKPFVLDDEFSTVGTKIVFDTMHRDVLNVTVPLTSFIDDEGMKGMYIHVIYHVLASYFEGICCLTVSKLPPQPVTLYMILSNAILSERFISFIKSNWTVCCALICSYLCDRSLIREVKPVRTELMMMMIMTVADYVTVMLLIQAYLKEDEELTMKEVGRKIVDDYIKQESAKYVQCLNVIMSSA